MEPLKHTLGVLAMILCMAVIGAAIWFFVVQYPNSQIEMEGTFVDGFRALERVELV